MQRAVVGLLGLSFAVGCTSSYEPARSPRIATVMDRGEPTFVKDGVHFGSQVWGTGLEDAVQSSPQAAHHARVGRNLIAGGFVLSLAGLGAEIGGLVVLVKDNNQQPDAQASGAGVALLVGGLATVLAGTVLISAGQPHLYDAINIYNDSVDPRPLAAPTPALVITPASASASASAPAPLGPRAQ